MIILAILVYAAFINGTHIPTVAFVGAAIFDLAMVEQIGESIAKIRGN